MKTNKAFRDFAKEPDSLHRGTKLSPIKKSGKERRGNYSDIDDEEEGPGFLPDGKRESIFDYFDDDEEDD